MSAALPSIEIDCCPVECDEVVVQNIPGPVGEDGAAGAAGADGESAITTLGFAFTMPAELAEDNATLASTASLVIGENVFVQGLGTLQVTAILSTVQATLKNLKDAATSAYASNAAPGTIAPTGSRVGPTGVQGTTGATSGAAAGDLKGTYPNPKLLIPNALGALAVGNGTDAVSLSMGVAGYMLINDPTTFPATGIGYKRAIPLAGDTNAASDRLVRLSAATGVPIPIEVSRASLKDPGGAGLIVADDTTGNARGTDAVDLQVSRVSAGVTAVASGSRAVIAGGHDNTASADSSVVSGGNNNANSGLEAFIGGGKGHIVDCTQSTIVGGDTNKINGGAATEAFLGGGSLNKINGAAVQAVLVGGDGNTVAAARGVIGGGAANIVTGTAAVIVGGINTTADKYAQRAFSAGPFSAQADCQQSDLIWRISTTGIILAPGTEMFLDGATLRATIAQGRTVAFDILITARSSTGLNAAWSIKGIINNLAGVTTIDTVVVNALIADNSVATFGTLANVPVVSADDANDSLVIHVKNPAATNVRWVAHGRLVELGY